MLCHLLTCLGVTLVLAGIQEASSTQFTDPGPTGVLLVVQQDLGRVQPVWGIELAPLQQDEPGSWGQQSEQGWLVAVEYVKIQMVKLEKHKAWCVMHNLESRYLTLPEPEKEKKKEKKKHPILTLWSL